MVSNYDVDSCSKEDSVVVYKRHAWFSGDISFVQCTVPPFTQENKQGGIFQFKIKKHTQR